MNLGRGYNLPDSTLRKIVALDRLAQAGPYEIVPLPDEARDVQSETHAVMVGDLQEFAANGWIELYTSGGGGHDARMTGTGRGYWEQIRDTREAKPKRMLAARDAVLEWLHDAYLNGTESSTIADFFTTRYAIYLGRVFESEEVDKATRWLKEAGYIDGQGAWGAGILNPRLLRKGEQLVESGRSVNDPERPPEPRISIGDNNNILWQSPNSTQTVTTTITNEHRQQILRIAQAVKESGGTLGLPPETTTELEQAAASSDVGFIRSILTKTREKLQDKAASVIAGYVIADIDGLLQLLPHHTGG